MSPMILIIDLKHSVICIFNENTETFKVKTSEKDVKYTSFKIREMGNFRELYSWEGDTCYSSWFEGKQLRGNTHYI